MAEATASGGEPTPAAPAPTAAPTTGTEPAKPASSPQGFDPTTLSDEDFTKIYSDPRTFTHPRFKALNEQAKEAEKLKSEAEQAANAQLEKDKKYQELAQKHEARATELLGKFETTLTDNKITQEAVKLGITDIDAATKLIDRSGISVDANGVVMGVEEAIKSLVESKTYLVDKSKQVPTIGSPSNPGSQAPSNGAVRTFKASEISDPTFYREHATEIGVAMRTPGAIVNDMPGRI